MTIRKNSIVLRMDYKGDWSETNYRVESVDGRKVALRSLDNYMLGTEDADNLEVRYQVDTFDPGDTVRIRKEYADRYNEADGGNELTVVYQKSGNVPTTMVKNNNGEEFGILNERLFLVRPGKSFKAGDRVVVDLGLAKRYDNDGVWHYWENVGVLVLTEDSGSRSVKTTSHVLYEKKDGMTNNVPTRWLKLYEEPAKRVVGVPIHPKVVMVGDTIRATYSHMGMNVSSEGVVNLIEKMADSTQVFYVDGGARFPLPGLGTVYTLLEEAPAPVDENLQRLLDAEIGDIAYSTYAAEYWKKVGDDEWRLLELDSGLANRTTEHVFNMFYKLKYGTLEFYRKVNYVD